MAQLALPVCVIFIAFLLARDVLRRKSLSPALWLPVTMLVILASRPLSEWLGGSETASAASVDEGSPIDRTFYLAILFTSLIVASIRQAKWSRILSANIPIVLLYSYFAVSVLWSEDPLGSFKRCGKDFGFLFVIAVMMSEKRPLEAIRAVYVRCAYVLIPLSVVLIKYYPQLGRAYTIAGDVMSTGVTPQKNTLGEMVFISMLFLIWDFIESRTNGVRRQLGRIPWVLLLLLGMGFWLLDKSQSKTALICVIIGTCLLLRGRRFNTATANRFIFAGALSLPFLVYLSQEFSWLLAPVVEAMGRDMTFTGRTEIWSQINRTTVNPIIGAGFWSFWGSESGAAIKEALHTGIPSAHNGYVDIYLDGGLIGLGLLFTLLLATGRRLIRDIRSSQSKKSVPPSIQRFHRFRFAILIIAIIYNMSESAFARPIFTWFTTLLVLYEFPQIKIMQRQLRELAARPERSTELEITTLRQVPVDKCDAPCLE